jgi:hypothetical protein
LPENFFLNVLIDKSCILCTEDLRKMGGTGPAKLPEVVDLIARWLPQQLA